MSYLLDASALLDLIKRKKKEILNQYILDLTIYGIGNAIWKEANLFKTLTEEALNFMKNFANIKAKMKIITIQNDLKEIMKTAINEKLTFYDVAYLYFATKKQINHHNKRQKNYMKPQKTNSKS